MDIFREQFKDQKGLALYAVHLEAEEMELFQNFDVYHMPTAPLILKLLKGSTELISAFN